MIPARLSMRGKLLFPFLGVISILIFTRFSLVAFLGLIFILSILTADRQRDRVAQGLWVYLYFFCYIVLAYALGSLARYRLSPEILLVPPALLAWWLSIKPVNKARPKHRPNRWGVAAGLLICAYACLPVIASPSSAAVLRYSAKTLDDTSHIARIEAIRRFGGYLYQQKAETAQLIDPGTAVSPQGWHANGAFLESLIVKSTGSDSINIRLLSYFAYKVLWLFMAVFLLYGLSNKIQGLLFGVAGRFSNFMTFIGIGAVSGLFLVSIFGYGFQNFIAVIAMVCASLIISVDYLVDKNEQAKRKTLFILGLFTVTALYVWTLGGTIVGLITLALVIKELSQKFKQLLSRNNLLAAVLLAVLASFPLYQLAKSGSQRGFKTINMGGATPPINSLGVIAFLLITTLLISRLRPKKSGWLIILLLLAGLEFLVLAGYQQLALGEIRYYVIKLAFLFCAVMAGFFLAALHPFAARLAPSKKITFLIYIAALCLMPLLLGLDLRKSAYPLKDSAPIKSATANEIIRVSSSKADKDMVIKGSDNGETFLANKLLSSVELYNPPQRKQLLDSLDRQL